MKSTKTVKSFDCIAYKRKVQSEIYEDIRDLSGPEQIEYFRRRAEEGPLGDWWRSIKRAKAEQRSG